MSNELQTLYTRNSNIYAVVVAAAGSSPGQYYNTNSFAWENFNAANWAYYAIDLTENSAGVSGQYFGNLPYLGQGYWTTLFFAEATAATHSLANDTPIGQGAISTDLLGQVCHPQRTGLSNLNASALPSVVAFFAVSSAITTPATADNYFPYGVYNGKIYYAGLTVQRSIWWNGAAWVISQTPGTNGTTYFVGGATIAGTYTAAGTATGSPIITAHGASTLATYQPELTPITAGAGAGQINPDGAGNVFVGGFLQSAITGTASQIAASFSTFWNVVTGRMTAASYNQGADNNVILSNGTYGNAALQTAVASITNFTSLAVLYGPTTMVRPQTSTEAYLFTMVVKNETGALVALDASPTITIKNTAGTDRSANLGAITNPQTGIYQVIYTCTYTDANEDLQMIASGTVATAPRIAFANSVVADAESNSSLATILAQVNKFGFDGSNNVKAIVETYASGEDPATLIGARVIGTAPTANTWDEAIAYAQSGIGKGKVHLTPPSGVNTNDGVLTIYANDNVTVLHSFTVVNVDANGNVTVRN